MIARLLWALFVVTRAGVDQNLVGGQSRCEFGLNAGMLSVFDLDPVLLPTTAVRPVAMLGNQTLNAKLTGLAE